MAQRRGKQEVGPGAKARAAQLLALGNQCREAGDLEGAQQAFRQVLKINRSDLAAQLNLAAVLRQQGRPEEAVRALRQLLRQHSETPAIHYNLAIALQQLGRLEDSAKAYRKAIALAPDLAQAHGNLGVVLEALKRPSAAVASLRRAIELEPGNLMRRRNLHEVVAKLVPEWHMPMMNDADRNQAYQAAIDKAVKPGMEVLEIGTGSGLLAMMAARAGAARVTTCERVEVIADLAREIVAANGLAERITVIAEDSRDLVVGRDLPAKADLLISEIVSGELIGEHMVATLSHAHQELLKPGADAIPERAAVWAMLIGGAGFAHNFRVEEVAGFDLSAFNALRRSVVRLRIAPGDCDYLSTPRRVLALEAPYGGPAARQFTVDFPVTSPGRCTGVAQWISLDLAGGVTYDNDPRRDMAHSTTSWKHQVYPFDKPLDLAPGQTLRLSVAYAGAMLTLGLPEVLS